MVAYLSDGIPVESLAFPYIFYMGREGTWRPLAKDCPLTLSEYARIRCLCYDSVASLDRAYILSLYCEKVKDILFDAKRFFFARKGEFNQKQIVTGKSDVHRIYYWVCFNVKEFKKRLDGQAVYSITCGIPGSVAYLQKARKQILSAVFHRGPPSFFITITAHPGNWRDLMEEGLGIQGCETVANPRNSRL